MFLFPAKSSISVSLSFIDYVAFIINVASFLLEFSRVSNHLLSSDISKSCLKIIFSLIEASITINELRTTSSFVVIFLYIDFYNQVNCIKHCYPN